MLKTVIKQFWLNTPQPQKVMFNVVKTGTLVKRSVLYYTLISNSDSSWSPQLITSQVSEKLLLRFIKSQQLKAAGQICWWICSLWFEQCLTRAQSHYTQLSFITSHVNDIRLLQNSTPPHTTWKTEKLWLK